MQFAIFPLITFFVNLFLSSFILSSNPKDRLNRIYFFVTCSLIIWSFGDVMFFLSSNPNQVILWDKLTSIGSSLTIIFLLHFFFVFSKRISHITFAYASLYILPSIFIPISLFTNLINQSVSATPWGYETVQGKLYLPYTLTLVFYVLLGMGICFVTFRNSKSSQERTQAILLILAESIPLMGGIALEIIPAIFNYHLIPLTSTLSTVTAIVIAYTMLRHGLMTITPETAAENIIQTMRDYLIVLDEEKNITLINRACLQALGYKKEEVIGKNSVIIFDEEISFDTKQTILKTKTGQKLPVVFNISSIRNSLIFVLRDMREMNALINNLEETQHQLKTINYDLETKVSERTRELESLKNTLEKSVEERTKQVEQTEKRLSQIAQDADEWIWEIDTDGIYTYSSPIVEKILGYTVDEIIGKKYYYDFFPENIREELRETIEIKIRKKEKFQRFLNPNVHKNGTIVFLETNASPIINNEGITLGYIGADSDITERKKAEEELKIRAEELEKMNSLMVGREIKMAELKKEINDLRLQH